MLEISPFPVPGDRCVRGLSSASVIRARDRLKGENKWIYKQIYKYKLTQSPLLATQLHKGIVNAFHQSRRQQEGKTRGSVMVFYNN